MKTPIFVPCEDHGATAVMTPLRCPGVGRDKDCITALQFYFSRPVRDDEMRFLHDVMRRAVARMKPQAATEKGEPT